MQSWIAAAILAAILAWAPLTARAQTPPTRAFGTVTVDGQPAPPGTTVQALIGDKVCGEGEVRRVSDAIPRGYVVDVVSATQMQGCGTDGDRIIFKVGGKQANETAEFHTGTFLRHDLTVSGQVSTPTPGPTPPPFGPATPEPGGTATGTAAPGSSPSPRRTAAAPSDSPSPRFTATAPAAEVEGDGDGGSTGVVLVAGAVLLAVLAAGGVGYYLSRRRGA